MTPRTGSLLVFASAVGWSTAGLFARAIPADVMTVVFWRGMFGAAGLLLLIICLQGRPGLALLLRLGWAGWAYAAVSAASMFCFIGALKNTSIAHVSIIYATVPFAAAGLGYVFLRERPSVAAMVASFVALGGAMMMVGFSGDGHWTGDLLAVGMVLGGSGMILIARAYPGMPTLAAAAMSALLAPLVALPMATLGGLGATTLVQLFGFGLINTTMALALFIIGSRHLPAVRTALLSALETPMTPLWVWLVFAETPSPATLAGGTVVFAAVVWYVAHESRLKLP
jgi:drug/metabolite transporter (DMT)-like permease